MFPETFEIDSDFLKCYNDLINRHWAGDRSGSLNVLLKDLCDILGCRAAYLLELNGNCEGCYKIKTVCFGIGDTKWASKVLDSKEAQQFLWGGLQVQNFTGRTISLRKGCLEVDVIYMPRLSHSVWHDANAHVFVLLDALCLKPVGNHMAERNCQRALVAQLLTSWWTMAFTPKARLNGNDEESGGLLVSRLPLWMHAATLQELAAKAIADAMNVRKAENSQDAPVYFREEIANIAPKFDWNNWEPLLPPAGLRYDQLNLFRKNAKCLVWWCRWVGAHSHCDLERARGEDKVTKWVKKHRFDAQGIDDEMHNLHVLAGNSFLAGNAELALSGVQPQAKKKIVIGRSTLLCFSINQWLDPDGYLRKRVNSGAFSDVEFCRALHGVAVTALHAFGQRREGADDVVHRLMQLLASYGHGELGIPARIDLRAHLLHSARSEPALHSLKPFYRDHYFHALEVCFLGHLLLDTHINDEQRLWQLVAANLGLEADRKRVLRLWYLAALLHDVGYAMDVFNRARRHLGFFRHSEPLAQLAKDVGDAVARLTEGRALGSLGLPMQAGLGQDHGVVGALHVKTLIERIARDDCSVKLADYQPSVRAIALHNLRRHDQRVSFGEEPLAFLLAVCDQLQEWKRPRLHYSTAAEWMLGRLAGDVSELSDLEGPFHSLKAGLKTLKSVNGKINYGLHPTGDKPCLPFTATYGEGINRNSALFHQWLDATLNFQRLDFDNFPCRITVEYVSPLFSGDDGKPKMPQLHRLRDAAHETHMSFLDAWFPTNQGEGDILTNGAISHRLDQDNGLEHLTLDAEALSRKALITRDTDAFWKQLQQWKHFNDDRDFPGDYAEVEPG